MYKLETSIDTKIVSLPIFVFSIKLMKSVVSHCQKSWTFRVRDNLSAASLFKMADKNNRSQGKRFPYDILNNLSSLDLFYEVYIP